MDKSLFSQQRPADVSTRPDFEAASPGEIVSDCPTQESSNSIRLQVKEEAARVSEK